MLEFRRESVKGRQRCSGEAEGSQRGYRYTSICICLSTQLGTLEYVYVYVYI